MKVSFIAIGLIFCLSAIGQKERKLLSKHFDSIRYKNGKVEAAYQTVKHVLHGYYIGFDSTRGPLIIGEYAEGKKSGIWFYSDDSVVDYRNDPNGEVVFKPACGYARREQLDDIGRIYRSLVKKVKW